MGTVLSRAALVIAPAASVVAIAVGFAGGVPAAGVAAAVVAPAPAAPTCRTDDLAATVTGRHHGAVRTASLQLTNVSEHACRIAGTADVALVTPPGELVDVDTRRAAAATAFDLAPQASTWAALRWDTCRPVLRACGVGVALQFRVDIESDGVVAELADLPEADVDGITMMSLEIGPLLPTADAAYL